MSDKFQVKAYAAKEDNCSCKNSKATSSFLETMHPVKRMQQKQTFILDIIN